MIGSWLVPAGMEDPEEKWGVRHFGGGGPWEGGFKGGAFPWGRGCFLINKGQKRHMLRGSLTTSSNLEMHMLLGNLTPSSNLGVH